MENKWIKVEDKLPNENEMILVYCELGVTMATYQSFTNGNQLWWAITRIGTYEDSGVAKNVTHWMQLESLIPTE